MVTQKSLQQFHTLILHFYRHVNSNSNNNNKRNEDEAPETIVEILNDLDEVDAPIKNVPDQQIIDILIAGCKCLTIDHEACPSFCKFMFKACAKQIRLASLRSSQFEICITFLLDGLEQAKDTTTAAELRVDMLRALSALVFENASNASKYYPKLSNLLLGLADRSTRPLEVRRMAINCIGNSCANSGSKLQPYYAQYYQALLSNVCVVEHGSHGTMMVASSSLDFTDSAVRKVASSTLRALQFVLSQDKTLVTNPLCDIVQIIQRFIFTSVSTHAYNAMLKEDSVTASTSTRLGRMARVQQQVTATTTIRQSSQISWRSMEPRVIGLTSSDSELSDTGDTTMANPRRQRDDAKIRINALLCLTAIAKTSPRALYPHWQKFIPDTFSIFLMNNTDQHGHLYPTLQSDNQPLSLCTILLYDPTTTVRTAVCNTLIAMLDGSRQYLSVASERDSKSPFTSLSERVASILRDFHAGLICALEKEQQPQVLTLIMKLACVLIVNTPYDRLAPGYVEKLYKTVMKRWTNGTTIRTSILAVVSAILENGPRSQVTPLLDYSLPLIDLLLESTAMTPQDTELVAMAWQTLGIVSKTHSDATFNDKYQFIDAQFDEALKDKEATIRIAALKFAESYAASMVLTNEVMNQYLPWWITMLEKHIQSTSMDISGPVRSMTCDCLASMSKDIYEQLPPKNQTLAITLLLPLASDQDTNVRAAACRALGVFILFPSLHDDPLFVSDMASAILEQMNDKSILVRARASWAQGNLCDALVIESEKPEFDISEWISMQVWADILTTATSAALDNDKLRSNAVRAIGSLLRITPHDYFRFGRNLQLVKNAMAGVTKNIESGSLKTRWNACHAASNILKNPVLPIGGEENDYPWTDGLYRALIHSVRQCRNYKVRINACRALATPQQRIKYGQQFDSVVQAILTAWEACHKEEENEFQEYRYKEQLKDQVREALHHIQNLQQPP